MITPEFLEQLDGTDNLAVSAYEGAILNRIVREYKPKTIVEMGTGNSYSTAWMAIAMEPDCLFYTIDAERRKRYDELPVKYLLGSLPDHMDILPKVLDIVFLDSDHTIDKIVKDIELLQSRLQKNSLLAVHDTIYCEEMGYCLRDYFEQKDSSRLQRVNVKPSSKTWDYKHLRTRFGLGIAVSK